jgi:hypothetical protein
MAHVARVTAALGLAALWLVAAPRVGAQRAVVRDDGEGAYALAIARTADSAIHRLDFYSTRAQLRAQMLFLAPRDTAVAIFFEIARRSSAAAQVVDETLERFERTRVPDDLHDLHATLLTALRAARGAADRLATAAQACEVDPSSVARCQTPFGAASSAVVGAYGRYLDARGRIARQILDTQTVLPAFVVSVRR